MNIFLSRIRSWSAPRVYIYWWGGQGIGPPRGRLWGLHLLLVLITSYWRRGRTSRNINAYQELVRGLLTVDPRARLTVSQVVRGRIRSINIYSVVNVVFCIYRCIYIYIYIQYIYIYIYFYL